MQKSITESEECLERKMVQFTERKIAEVNKRRDAFELRVLARPAPLVDVSTLQTTAESLRAGIDMRPLLWSLLRIPCWLPFLLLKKFHYLPLERVTKGVVVEKRTRREQV